MYRLLIALIICSNSLFAQTFTEPDMVFVEGGPFEMGIDGGLRKEEPRHTVVLSDYYISKYEVTQELWTSVMGSNPANFNDCPKCPVEEVTPETVDEFLKKLNAKTGKNYRLPTEAEWEYAAIGGKKTQGYRFSGSETFDEVAWNKHNADDRTHPVGQKKPNELGLYDMSGNVWELCQDWYYKHFYKESPKDNPVYLEETKHRLVRGGSWRSGANRCYNQARNRNIKDHHIANLGFRVVLPAE